jgi:Trk K+ transport system NAD-binding subunit
MKKSSVLIFGNNEYGLEIAKNVTHKYKDITIFSLDEMIPPKDSGSSYNIEKFDLSDEWDDIKKEFDIENSIIFCALNDEAQNIFLTISLRSAFEKITIIALANNNEDANKLRMAGASKVIPIVETTADIITDMLKKPIITEVLHDILYENSDLKVEQIKVGNHDYFEGKYPSDIEWSRDHGIIVLSVIHEDMSSEFIYSSKAKHHAIKAGDIFVVVGYETDLLEFEKLVKE